MAGNLTAMIASIFSGSAVSTDPYFNLTTLLLSTTATNGAQNNIFQDSSTNNFTITRNGNTTQGTFSPFSQTGWSNYFDGTGDYLTIPDNAAFDLAAGDFLIEAWAYSQSSTNFKMIMGQWGTSNISYTLRQNAGKWVFTYTTNNSTEVAVNGTSTQVLNAWTHLAVIRTGNTLGLFVNGTRETTASMTGVTIYNNTGVFSVGGGGNGSDLWVGYIGASRLVKTTLPSGYDATLTTCPVPTAPFSPTATTSVIVCQSNRFIDNSNNNFTITRNGDTSVAPFSPFNPTSAWSASTVGGSGYFDGTGDYLDELTATTAFNLSTGDWTIEAWIYRSVSGVAHAILNLYNTAGSNSGLTFYVNASNQLVTDNGATAALAAGSVGASQWVHMAIVRSGGTTTGYINGSSVGTTAQAPSASQYARVGALASGAYTFNGYIANLRVIKGTAVYTGNFTPPTAPITDAGSTSAASYPSTTNVNTSFASSATSLLLNFTNSGIYDATAKNVLETVGSAQVSNTTSQWPSTSMSFNGTTDYLQVNTASDLYNLSSGNWTIEAWVYRTGTNLMSPISYLNGSGTTLNGWTIQVNVSSAGTLYWASHNASTSASGSAISGGNVVPLNAWTYIAVTCVGTTITLYVNGASVGTGTRGTIGNDSSCRLRIGGMNYTSVRYWQGYIQDPRITKGYARTIATPTAAFPVQ